MAYFGGGGQNGATGRGGNGANPQTILQGTQLFVNPNQIQFQGGGNQNYSYSQGDNSQSQLQLSTGGTPLLLQPPVNFVTDQIGLGQLISQAAATQNQQNLQNMMNLGNVMNPPLQMSEGGSSGTTPKQRVFTGTVTKIHDNFGFIDEEVFFSMQVVKGPVLPKEGDRVLVEADFNPTMPFKWTSTRVQIVNMAGGTSHASQASTGGYPYNSPIPTVNKSLAPPPPSISGRPQPVAIVSNPHSVYSSRPSMTETMPSRRVLPLSTSDSSIMSTGVNSMNSMGGGGGSGGGGGGGMMGGGIGGALNDVGHRPMSGGLSDNLRMNDRDLQRKEKDRIPSRDLMSRERERSKERQTKDRDRRERSRERDGRRRSRSRSRDRRSKRDPSPARKRSRERDRGRDRSATVKERSPKASADPRSRRSRSRDTIKSSDGRSVRSSVSPHRKGTKSSLPTVKAPRYAVQSPQFSLDMLELNGTEIKRRYPNLYIPSDFFLAKATWMQAFPLHQPYALGNSTVVHIFGRHVQQLEAPDPQGLNNKFKQVSSVHPAPDASCTFTVKVMLLSCATLPNILKKCGCTNEEVVDEKETNQPLLRLLQFAVGVKSGAHEVIALGGSWSPSLDGLNPQSDPKVLVNTALRCVKAQAGIDLSRVTKWYRFMELYYRRNNGNLETVVYFLPDTNPSTIPGQMEWDTIRSTYRLALYGKEVALPAASAISATTTAASSEAAGAAVNSVDGEEASKLVGDETTSEETQKATVASTDGEGAPVEDEKVGEKEKLDEILQMEVVDECNGDDAQDTTGDDVANPTVSKVDNSFDIYDGIVEGDKEPVCTEDLEKSIKLRLVSIDPKSMTVVKLREELSHRNLNTKGLKQELVARLTQALKDDEEEAAKEISTNDKVNLTETPTEPAEIPICVKKEPDELDESQPNIKIVDPCSIMEASIEGEEAMTEDAEKEEESSDGEFPIIKESMSAEEKKVWERRYSVPKTPKLLVYPSKGDPSRDCTLMSLSTLRDYRASDKKEESFEVSLFSEFFYEMLQRDFAFKIYRELRKEYRKVSPEKVKTEMEEEKKEDASSEPATKRRKTSTETTPPTAEKLKIVDPMLLLAFSFFDTTHCGYIMEVDLEEICASIGIGITKRTIRKMAQKVVSKGSLHYRKLTDKPESEVGQISNEDTETIKKLAMGNKVMLPVFSFSETEIVIDDNAEADGDGTVNGEAASPVNAVIDGQVFDVRLMKNKLEKAEKALTTAEASVNVLKNSLNEAKNQVSELQKSNDSFKEKLNKTKETLKKTEASDKAAKDDLEVFKRASERFVDRIKGLVKLPTNSKESSKDNSKEKSTSNSNSKAKEISTDNEKPVATPIVEDYDNSSNTANASEK